MTQLPAPLKLEAGRIVFPDSVCAMYVDEHGRLLLVRQKRSMSNETLELPGGKVNRGETFDTAVLRELEEEAGIKARSVDLSLSIDLDLSVSVHRTHLFSVSSPIKKTKDHEFGLAWLPVPEAIADVRRGLITHAPTVVGILLLADAAANR